MEEGKKEEKKQIMKEKKRGKERKAEPFPRAPRRILTRARRPLSGVSGSVSREGS